jgi:hypothetical protein
MFGRYRCSLRERKTEEKAKEGGSPVRFREMSVEGKERDV